VTAGLPTVAVRVPSHPIAHALLRAAGIPVAAPSANRSTQISPTTAGHVAKSLRDAVDLILDGGPTPVGIESTVLDLSTPIPTLLRPGIISIPELEAAIGPVAMAAAIDEGAARPSPGMLDKHYAPNATLLLVPATDVQATIDEQRRAGRRVGAITMTIDASNAHRSIALANDATAYAAALYGALHTLDDDACDVIVAEQVPHTPEWLGVADRLRRAAYRTESSS
jgi:L-threonylcarbamoyladenylate synthase